MKLVYQVKDRPPFGKTLVFALQQLLAILAATIAVPAVINSGIPGAAMSQSAALFGAGVGTLVYLLFTKFRSPVFLGSSFAFIGSMLAAFAGSVLVVFADADVKALSRTYSRRGVRGTCICDHRLNRKESGRKLDQ